MHEPLVPMFFPVLGAHISGAEFQYPDHSWKEPCGIMANLVGDSGCNKGQLSNLVEAICRDFRGHDEEELKKLVEWLEGAGILCSPFLNAEACHFLFEVSPHLPDVHQRPSLPHANVVPLQCHSEANHA